MTATTVYTWNLTDPGRERNAIYVVTDDGSDALASDRELERRLARQAAESAAIEFGPVG